MSRATVTRDPDTTGSARVRAAAAMLARNARLTWRRWRNEQRVVAVLAALVIASTFGPFSFVELAQAVVAVALLVLLWARANGKAFHLPGGDGTIVAVAGGWLAFLILVRLFSRPLGQSVLALACALLLVAVGVRERSRGSAFHR